MEPEKDSQNFKTAPPEWLTAKLAKQDAHMDPDEQGAIRVYVCRNCQCALPDCLCGEIFAVDNVLIWRPKQGLNTRLSFYLKNKKDVHAAERAQKTANGKEFVPYTAEDMQRRITLWASVPRQSNHPAATYMRKLFVNTDRVLVQLIHANETWVDHKSHKHAKTEEYPRSLEGATSESFMALLTKKNAEGWNVYVTMNPIHADSKGRKKSDIAEIRSVYIEVDEDGEVCLAHVLGNGHDVPRPNVVLESSPKKFQFIWFVKSFTGETQEALNEALVAKFNGDEACIDRARVLRLPGFHNMKKQYDPKPLVTIFCESGNNRYTLEDFHTDITPKPVYEMGEKASDEKIAKRAQILESLLMKANCNYSPAIRNQRKGLKWEMDCPDPDRHITDKTAHGACLLLNDDASIGWGCRHAGCKGFGWVNCFKPWLEQVTGEKIIFEDDIVIVNGKAVRSGQYVVSDSECPVSENSVSEPASETLASESDNATGLIFDTAKDIAIAQQLGYAAELPTGNVTDLIKKYAHVIVWNKSTYDVMFKKIPGFEFAKLPPDRKAAPEIRYGREVYPPTASLEDAKSQYSDEFLTEYIHGIVSSEAYQKSSTRDNNEKNNVKFDMTDEEIAYQEQQEFPVYKLHEPAGPHFDELILYGLVGEIAMKISRYNESHIGSLYLNLLVSLGNMMGRHAYFNINKSTHYPVEFLACVGESSTARKGTGSDEIEDLLRQIDPQWMNTRNLSGFGSSQGIIYQLRDDSTRQVVVRKGEHKGEYETKPVPGVVDKRLCIRENELSGLLKLMADPREKADELLRNMWDGKPLRNLVSGKSDRGEEKSLICREPHGSIVGYTVPELIKSTMPVGADYSGTGNRFLYCFIKRMKLVPRGGPPIDWTTETWNYRAEKIPILQYLCDMIGEAKKDRHLPLAVTAHKYWDKLYRKLESVKTGDHIGRMTSRGAAHVRRLAAIFCLIDREEAVRVEHLKAALAIWEYSVESAKYIFKGYSREGEKILGAVKEKGSMTLTDFHNLFNRNRTAEWVRAQVTALVNGGFLTKDGESYKFKKW